MSEQIDVTSLSPSELNKLRQSLSEDVQLITNNFGNLKVAQARYSQALEAVHDIKAENQGKQIMIPLTGSMYVPGKLAAVDSVLVDVGTGYYVDKSISAANGFIQNKLRMIAENLDKVGMALQSKRRDLEAVTIILQEKMAAQKVAQDQQLKKLDQLITPS